MRAPPPSDTPPAPDDEPIEPGRDASELFRIVYEQLKEIARQRMALEKRDHTLQPTALVHEAFLRLDREKVRYISRAHLFRAATVAMHRILIEHARKRNRVKRGRGVKPQPLNLLDLAEEMDAEVEILALNGAIRRLKEHAPLAADVVRHRFFGGLTIHETAEAVGLSSRSVDREWAYARAWLFRELGQEASGV